MSKAEELSESLCRMDTFTGFQRDEILKAAAELRRLQAENEVLRKDAERYRWLKKGCNDKGTKETYIAKELFGFEWDRAIDAAMKGKP